MMWRGQIPARRGLQGTTCGGLAAHLVSLSRCGEGSVDGTRGAESRILGARGQSERGGTRRSTRVPRDACLEQ
jgi:hypothetical protein